MNVLLIRDLADTTAREAFHRLYEHHARTGVWDRRLAAEWHAAEALFDLAVERIRDMMADTFDPSEGGDPLPDVPLADPGDIFVFPAGVGR